MLSLTLRRAIQDIEDIIDREDEDFAIVAREVYRLSKQVKDAKYAESRPRRAYPRARK